MPCKIIHLVSVMVMALMAAPLQALISDLDMVMVMQEAQMTSVIILPGQHQISHLIQITQ